MDGDRGVWRVGIEVRLVHLLIGGFHFRGLGFVLLMIWYVKFQGVSYTEASLSESLVREKPPFPSNFSFKSYIEFSISIINNRNSYNSNTSPLRKITTELFKTKNFFDWSHHFPFLDTSHSPTSNHRVRVWLHFHSFTSFVLLIGLCYYVEKPRRWKVFCVGSLGIRNCFFFFGACTDFILSLLDFEDGRWN